MPHAPHPTGGHASMAGMIGGVIGFFFEARVGSRWTSRSSRNRYIYEESRALVRPSHAPTKVCEKELRCAPPGFPDSKLNVSHIRIRVQSGARGVIPRLHTRVPEVGFQDRVVHFLMSAFTAPVRSAPPRTRRRAPGQPSADPRGMQRGSATACPGCTSPVPPARRMFPAGILCRGA